MSSCLRAARGFVSRRRAQVAALGISGLVAACGGGGDSGPVTSTATFPVASAVNAFVTASHQYDLTGALPGIAFTARYVYTPAGTATFEGRSTSSARQTVTLTATGVAPQTSTSTVYFTTGPYVQYGSIDDDGSYDVFNQTGSLPASARVGDSGTLGTGTSYANSSKTAITGTTQASWTLNADTATTALFCINQTISGSPPASGAECYRVDTTGQVLGMVIKVNVSGQTLVLQ